MNNNKGYSLTELLLAIFVLSIVMLGIAGILRSTSQFYRNGVQEVRVQEEAQLAVNLIEEMLVDATSKPTFVAADLTDTDDTNDVSILTFKDENSADIKIEYYSESDASHPNQLVLNDTEILADYVTGFGVTGIASGTSDGDNKVSVSVSMDNSGYTYTANKEIYMRNLVENNTLSISTVPSGGGGGGSTWDAEILLNRYETFNLTIWYNADPSGTANPIGDFEQYFEKKIEDDSIKVTVDAAYLVQLGAASTNNCGLEIPIIGGGTKKIRFYYEAVSVDVSPNADIFVYPNSSDNMTGQGVSTVVEVKGINVNECLKASGATVTASLTLNGEKKEYTLSSQTKISESGKQEFNQNGNGKLLMTVNSDPCSNGLLIVACNGGFPNLYTHGQDSDMAFFIKIAPAGGQTPYSKTINYKFRISNDVL